MSFTPYWLKLLIDLVKVSTSLINILSPAINVPEVWDNNKVVPEVPPPGLPARYPVASLLTPLINELIGQSVKDIA